MIDRILLKPTEVVQATGLGRSTVYSLIASGVIPSIRIGRSVRVPAAGLREWVETQLSEQKQEREWVQ